MEKLRFLFFLLLPMVILANTGEKSLWDHVVKMEQVVLSVELNGRHLKVWKENSHGYNRFYVTPLCIIDTSLINCTKDDYSNEPRYVFSFFVRLWDSLAAETVRLALKQKDIEAKASDILPLPMQLIRLKISNDVGNNIRVDNEWRSNQDQPNTVLFEMYTKSKGFCNKMLQDAKNNPQTFLSRTKLTFEFSMLIGQQTYRNLNITGNTIGKSEAFSNLENNYSNQEGIVYLNSDDMNSLARNIKQEIVISEEVDGNYISTNQETQIINELLGIFKAQTVQSNDLSTNEWNSVFWDDIFSRPDIQTEYFNEVLTYDQGEKEFRYDHDKDQQFRNKIESRHSKQSQKSISGGGGFSYAGFGLNASGSRSNGNSNFDEDVENEESDTNDRMALEDIEKFIRKNNANVKWSGTKFEPKGLVLYRLNTRDLKTKGEILYKRIVSTKLTSTQRIEIRPEPKYTTDLKNTISPIHFEDLNRKISELSTNLSNQISTKIQETKTEFHQNLMKEIGNLNNALKVNVDNLNTAINNHVHNLNNALKINVDNLNTAINNHVHNLNHAHNVLHHYTHNDLKNWVAEINKHADGILVHANNILKRVEDTERRLSSVEHRYNIGNVHNN